MTLSNFKNNLRVVLISVLFLLYTCGVYFAGTRAKLLTPTDNQLAQAVENKVQSDIQNPQGAQSVQSARVLASFVKLCANTAIGFEIAYPKDWFTTYNNPQEQCMYFAPYSFVLPASTESAQQTTPISVTIEPAEDWENTVKLYQNPNDLYGIVDSQNLQINGRSVAKITATTTGAGSLPRGFARIVYLVFDSQKPIVVAYNQLEENADVSFNQKLLEDMVTSLKLF